MKMSDLERIISGMKASERDTIEVTANAVFEAVKATGAISLMPNPNLPLTGLLMFVHPEVYNRIQKMKMETVAALDEGDGER